MFNGTENLEYKQQSNNNMLSLPQYAYRLEVQQGKGYLYSLKVLKIIMKEDKSLSDTPGWRLPLPVIKVNTDSNETVKAVTGKKTAQLCNNSAKGEQQQKHHTARRGIL